MSKSNGHTASLTEMKVLTMDEVAGILKVSTITVYRLIQDKGLPAFKAGGTWRFLESRVSEWIDNQHALS